MSLAEEWKQLPGSTKMFIIGGGGTALFFLFLAIKNRNSNQSQQQQDTSIGPQMPATDPSAWVDSQDQQMQSMQQLIGGMNDSIKQYEQANQQSNQQNIKAMQDLIKQNQQATQQMISGFINGMATNPKYPTAKGPAASPKPKPSPPNTKSKPGWWSYLPSTAHFSAPKGGWNPNSVVDILKSHGYNADFNSRSKLANAMGIHGYKGTAEQNKAMMQSLHAAGLY